ncbi:hypothetical protein [Kitasatospora sp. McL0602]|uniref:hypothetical protein n=1 Tax=Kitasatospora sp. McL0602 TaxID=3439530 RepID=UPI003F896857
MKRRAVLPAAVAVALLLSTGPALAEDGSVNPVAAQAFDGDAPLADAPALARGCGQEYGCSFRVLPGLSREFTTAVVSLGNAAVNCTNKPITIERTVALESSTTDNIAGEISGSATLEGTIDNTTDVSGSAGISNTTTGTHTDITAPSDKGPNTSIANGGSVTVAGAVTGAAQLKLSAKATFALAFRASFSHEWKRTSTETTAVRFTVKSNDELQFGVLNAMTRTVGVLGVDGTGKLIKNVVVDSPSTVNVSSVVAQTFSASDRCLSLRPPGRSAASGGLIEVAPSAAPAGPVERYQLGAEGRWVQQ